jgi:hypothetical protein
MWWKRGESVIQNDLIFGFHGGEPWMILKICPKDGKIDHIGLDIILF